MKLLLQRTFKNDKYTIGKLYVIDNQNNQTYLCDTIEDVDRGLDDSMTLDTIKNKKVYCQTAIPTGTYEITMSVQSPSFSKKQYYMSFCNGYLPRLLNVKGFDGILIHRGVDEDSTCGCIIVGFNTKKGELTSSKEAFENLMTNYLIPCKEKNEKIYITIS